MPIGPGSRLGPYQVTALIGEGGMGQVWRAGQPMQLVRPGYLQSPAAFPRQFDVSPDGRRFLMIKEAEVDEAVGQIVVVVNWFEELKRLVQTN
jgi:hypothetical protein